MINKFDEKKRALLRYILKYIEAHLVEGKEFNTNRTAFGHDLNAYHYRGFKYDLQYTKMDIFEQLHGAVPVLLKYWKGDASNLVNWLKKPLDYSLSAELSTPPYDGENRDLWWNLYYVLKNLKEDDKQQGTNTPTS